MNNNNNHPISITTEDVITVNQLKLAIVQSSIVCLEIVFVMVITHLDVNHVTFNVSGIDVFFTNGSK